MLSTSRGNYCRYDQREAAVMYSNLLLLVKDANRRAQKLPDGSYLSPNCRCSMSKAAALRRRRAQICLPNIRPMVIIMTDFERLVKQLGATPISNRRNWHIGRPATRRRWRRQIKPAAIIKPAITPASNVPTIHAFCVREIAVQASVLPVTR